MRAAFIRTLSELARRDPRVALLTGDLGYTVVEPFAEEFPDRFFNVGVAEQNMVGIATGMAEAGLLPFTYSIATFSALRPYEFIRNGPVAHRLPVRVVGVGGGFEYGHAGFTHHALEDLAALRVFPELALIVPADGEQASAAMRATYDRPGPIYYRLGKEDRELVPGLGGRFRLGRLELLAEGDDALAFVAVGPIVLEALAAASALAGEGLRASVAVVSSLNPAPEGDLVALLRRHRAVLALEEHYRVGGLGSLVSELAAEHGLGCRVERCGVAERPRVSGSRGHLRRLCRISSEALVERARALAG
jgi:transketolase